ncbi:protein of unknown function DUF3475 [Dillenia turbinata]|uniref:Uncharacterized protein n=1 Tax=Dillenia turbinata TaxID=194707 RepID=A0AAN8W4C4_9MAGN
MEWLTRIGKKPSLATVERPKNGYGRNEKHQSLGILAFETAKTMSRLVSLYKSLSDDEFLKLRKEIMKSEGICYLNSEDERFLLNLACAERLEDLDHAANVISRLGRKCTDFGLYRFGEIYAELKLGVFDLAKLEYDSREIKKTVEKMEKYISGTASLYAGLETLTEMEISERKLNQWKKKATTLRAAQKTNSELFEQKITFQRRQVRHFREISLWNITFNKSVGLMARIVCVVYARICLVFGPYIPALPQVSSPSTRRQQINNQSWFYQDQRVSKSGPIDTMSKPGLIRFLSQESSIFLDDDVDVGFTYKFDRGCEGETKFELYRGRKYNKVFLAAPPNTLGGSGLALRYANVIIMAEKFLNSPLAIGEDAREDLYQMLPSSLKKLVGLKLRNNLFRAEELGDGDGNALADGWREGLASILAWLGPLAHDTVKWQLERNLEKRRFDAEPTVLLFQTLHYADREKTEAAIAEILVGLTCIYRYGDGPGSHPAVRLGRYLHNGALHSGGVIDYGGSGSALLYS